MLFRHKVFTWAVTTLVALTTSPATTAHAEPAPTHRTVAAVRPASPEAAFLIAVHQGNLAQIAAGKLAVSKSPHRTVRKLGKRFASYHKRLDSQVKRAASTLDVRLPAEPNSEQLGLVTQYRTAAGSTFDAVFIETQLVAYEHAAKLARLILKVSTDPTIIRIAETAAPVIEQHRVALTAAREELAREATATMLG